MITKSVLERTNTLSTQLVLEKLSSVESDEVLQELSTSLTEQLKTLSDLRYELCDDKIAYSTAKYNYDTAYIKAIQVAAGSNEKAREANAKESLLNLSNALEQASIKLEETRAAFEIEEYGWKLVRHILAAKYGGVYGSAVSGDVG